MEQLRPQAEQWPLEVYAIAWRFGYESLAGEGAKHSLSADIRHHMFTASQSNHGRILRLTTGDALMVLYEYHDKCRQVCDQVLVFPYWIREYPNGIAPLWAPKPMSKDCCDAVLVRNPYKGAALVDGGGVPILGASTPDMMVKPWLLKFLGRIKRETRLVQTGPERIAFVWRKATFEAAQAAQRETCQSCLEAFPDGFEKFLRFLELAYRKAVDKVCQRTPPSDS